MTSSVGIFGTFQSTIDLKGRVCIPSVIRNNTYVDGYGLYIFYNDRMGFYEVFPESTLVNKLKHFSDQPLTETFLYNVSPLLEPLGEVQQDGRIMIRRPIRDTLGIDLQSPSQDRNMVFFGLGLSFGFCTKAQWPELENRFRTEAGIYLQRNHPK